MFTIRTVKRGERVAVWNLKGEVRFVDGPARLILLQGEIEELTRFSAESHEYLAVRYLDGTLKNVRGPAETWFDPTRHESVTLEDSLPIDAHEALVVYAKQDDDVVNRRVLHGPAQYVPEPGEWLHEFRWHGADPDDPRQKIPSALRFSKLRVIPDQMYFDVEDVRTADDALLRIKLMLFFELVDIERMLDQTHDPIADFINALSADVIDFAARRSFEDFKEQTGQLNEIDQYTNLVSRSERIGYRVNKVVYRGYVASSKLQLMHDSAIEARTELKLEAETERQAQELADLKLEREAERDDKRRGMQRQQAEHEQQIQELKHSAEIRRREAEQSQEVAHLRAVHQESVEHLRAENSERLGFLREIQELKVDLTRYLVAQYQHPDRLIRVDGMDAASLHLHEE